MNRRHITIGLAGHIDHGKTSLVKALTGVNTDSLPEPQKTEFLEAIDVLAFNRIKSLPDEDDLEKELQNIGFSIRVALNRKTPSQIIAEAESARRDKKLDFHSI
jgi:translation initiation factor 2 gamma subunit (eIF-2gamma)